MSFMMTLFLLLVMNLNASNGDDRDVSTRIVTYNVCCRHGLENTQLSLDNRMPKVVNQIEMLSPDVLCIQEVRKTEAAKLCAHLFSLGYESIMKAANSSALSETLITAYKKNTYTLDEENCWWYNNEDPTKPIGNKWYKWGCILTHVRLLKKDKTQRSQSDGKLNIYNTHLGLAEDEKTFSIALALKLIKDRNAKDPIVWCGDFNFFDDKQGAEHRSMITSAGFQDALTSIKDQSGNQLSGTFVGYSDDAFKPKNIKDLSQLDGVFLKDVKGQPAVAYKQKLKNDLSNRDDSPSDHLPVQVELYW